MKTENIVRILREKLPEIAIRQEEDGSIRIEPSSIRDLALQLRNTRELSFDFLVCSFAIDYLEKMEIVYIFHSYLHNHQVKIRAWIDRGNAVIATIEDLYPTANWHEREMYDLFGVTFKGHPDLRRLLLPDEWEGAPMRKDYTHENLVRRPENK
ncbi:MAG: NADH-quinone oxidoreductase subunit C [Candidatus Eremiobacteraeota bacterium]|nr:NADH-quinone oxidoreductase subunit C [Candidatus Eremiobacteraeota bacterium]